MAAGTDNSVAKTRSALVAAAGAAVEPLLRSEEAADGDESRPPARARTSDPLVGELRRHDLLPLLVLHFIAAASSYGNQLIEQVSGLTEGVLSINPNTMYPLLRDLESRGLIDGQWEHPQRRSRRFYTITPAGRDELAALIERAAPALDAVAQSVGRIKAEIALN